MTARVLRELLAWALPAVEALPSEHLLSSLQKHAIVAQVDGELTASEYQTFMKKIAARKESEARKFARETKGLSEWDRTVAWDARMKKAVASGLVTANGRARKPRAK